MPVQIFMTFIIMAMVISASTLYWLDGFDTILSKNLIPE